MISVTLEEAGSKDNPTEVGDVVLGVFRHMEISFGEITLWANEPGESEDEMPTEKWLIDPQPRHGNDVLVWPVDGRDIFESNWQYSARRVSVFGHV